MSTIDTSHFTTHKSTVHTTFIPASKQSNFTAFQTTNCTTNKDSHGTTF